MAHLKSVAIDMPIAIVEKFQNEIDRGWDGEIVLDEKPFLVIAIELGPRGSGRGTVRVAKLKKL